MSTTEDPFERAAKRELRAKARETYDKYRHGKGWGWTQTPGASTWLRVFLFPYSVVMAIRALRFPWGNPTIGESVYDFFFGSLLVASVTIWILFLLWIWVITKDRGVRQWME